MSGLMGQPKPFASLSSSLLARKGHAKPAMRPQGFAGFTAGAEPFDDLGWNDMGAAPPAPPEISSASVSSLTPMLPPVLRQREELKEELEAPAPPLDLPAATVLASREPAAGSRSRRARAANRDDRVVPAQVKTKAAFTLRLDQERHLRLRLASALLNRSSQQLVTEALDEFLKRLPEVEETATRLNATNG